MSYTFNLCPQGDKEILHWGKKTESKVYHMLNKKKKNIHKDIVKVASELHKPINVKSDFIYYLWKNPVQMVKRWKTGNSAKETELR